MDQSSEVSVQRSMLAAMRPGIFAAVLFLLLPFPVQQARAMAAAGNTIQEYLVVGTVIWVHPESSLITIRHPNLLGHLGVRVKSYRVRQPSSLLALQSGDRIMAAFSRKDGMLHRLRRLETPQVPAR